MKSTLEWETKKRFGRTPVVRIRAIASEASEEGARLDVSDSKGLSVGTQCSFVIGGASAPAKVIEIAELESGRRTVWLSILFAGADYVSAIKAFTTTESADDPGGFTPD